MAGFGVWVCGNALWVAHGIGSGDAYVTVMFAFYWVTAVAGVVNCAHHKT